MISTAFWYILLHINPTFKQTTKSKENTNFIENMKKELLIQISNLTFEIKEKTVESLQKIMEKIYFDIVCQGVFYSLFYAFPKSRIKFDREFKCEVFKQISIVFKGCEVSHRSRFLKNWRFIDDWHLNLGAGNLLDDTVCLLKSRR